MTQHDAAAGASICTGVTYHLTAGPLMHPHTLELYHTVGTVTVVAQLLAHRVATVYAPSDLGAFLGTHHPLERDGVTPPMSPARAPGSREVRILLGTARAPQEVRILLGTLTHSIGSRTSTPPHPARLA